MATTPQPFLLGVHVSIAGGLENALYTGKALGCQCIQIFTHSNRQWKMPPLTQAQIDKFKGAQKQTAIHHVIVHASYLINLASVKEQIWQHSRTTLIKELEHCSALGIKYLVLHPGSFVNGAEKECLTLLTKGLNEAIAAVPGDTTILLENMAGQGNAIGYRFEQLAEIRSLITHHHRIGFCFDTCHAFSAGYQFNTPKTYEALWKEFDHIIGLNHLKAIHLNDSKTACGSHVDRHEHIGKGTLGLETFKLFINDAQFFDIPKILETPKDNELEDDMRNLTTLKNLLTPANKKIFI